MKPKKKIQAFAPPAMKNTKDLKPFTMADFEKGLMLAGYIPPVSEVEIIEREILNNYENDKES